MSRVRFQTDQGYITVEIIPADSRLRIRIIRFVIVYFRARKHCDEPWEKRKSKSPVQLEKNV